MSTKNSGSPVPRGDYEGHLNQEFRTAHGIWAHVTTQQAWQTASYENSWVDLSVTYNSAGYYKDAMGIVRLRGVAKDGTIGQTAFTLPVGYRPPKAEVFAVNSNGAFGACHVTAAGEVKPMAGNNAYFSFDGITFRAA